jgi:hypothetical protein
MRTDPAAGDLHPEPPAPGAAEQLAARTGQVDAERRALAQRQREAREADRDVACPLVPARSAD